MCSWGNFRGFPYRRLDEVSFVAESVASHSDLCARLLSVIDVSHNSVELELGDLRTLEGICFEGISDLESLHLLLECRHELVVDGVLDVNSGSGTAALAVIEEEAECGPLDGLVEIGIVTDDLDTNISIDLMVNSSDTHVRRFASQLEGDLLQVGLGSSLHDLSSDQG